MPQPSYSIGWGGGWDGTEEVVVVDDTERWMMPNPDLDSMGMAAEDGPHSSTDGADTAGGDNNSPGAADPTASTVPGSELCEVCGSGEDEANMLLCDSCPEGYHIYCLTPQLPAIPEGDWYCHKCEALGARTLVLEEADAIDCARRWYDTQSVFGTEHGLKMVPHAAFKNNALEWSVEYSTEPQTKGQPFLIRVRYAPERQGDVWTYKAVLFSEEGASKQPDKTEQRQEFIVEKILDMQRKKGAWEFKVKWVGYDKSTWERAQSFRDASLWKSMVAKVDAVMKKVQATEPESLKALRKVAWDIDKAVSYINRERDGALARQLQREAGGLRQGSSRRAITEGPETVIAESRSVTKLLKAAIPETWPPCAWKEGYKCDVKDVEGIWYEGTVVCVQLPHVKIRFKGFGDQYNEWKRVDPTPNEDQMQPLGYKTRASPAPAFKTDTSSQKRHQPAATTDAASQSASLGMKRQKTSTVARSSTELPEAKTAAAKTEPTPAVAAAKNKPAIKTEQPLRPPEHFLIEVKGKTREQRAKHWNKQRLVPLQTACKQRGLWPGGSRAHMRDRLLTFEFARGQLTEYDLSGPEATPASAPAASAASAPGAVVKMNGKIEYVIERVTDMKRATDGSWRYNTSWYGFPESENSWEPVESFNSKSMWSEFARKLAKVMAKTETDEDTALDALRNSQWDKKTAIRYVQKHQEKSANSSRPVATADDASGRAKKKPSLIIPEGSDSDEPDGTRKRTANNALDRLSGMDHDNASTINRIEASEPQENSAQGMCQSELEKQTSQLAQPLKSQALSSVAGVAATIQEERLTFRGEAIACAICGTDSAEQLRRGLCADGKVFCRRCCPTNASSSANGESPSAEASKRVSKIPRKRSASSTAFDSGGNFDVNARRVPQGPSAVPIVISRETPSDRASNERSREHGRNVSPRETQSDRASNQKSREHGRDRARNLDPHRSWDHDGRENAAAARIIGVCVRAPQTAGRDFGFIRRTSGASHHDLFFHRTAAFKGIKVGQEVTFTIGQNKRGPVAVDVRLAKAAAPMGEPPPVGSDRSNAAHNARPTAYSTASLRDKLNATHENSRSDSERFFLRHFDAVARVWGNRPIESPTALRKANDATLERVWQCLLNGDCEGFDSSIVNHVAAWHLAKGQDGFSDSTFETLLGAKRRQQRELERRTGRPIVGKVWSALEGTACEVELIDKAYSMQHISVPTRGVSCGHPRCYDMKTHIQEMIKKDRRKLWDEACSKLVSSFKLALVEKHTGAKVLKRAVELLQYALRQLPTPPGAEMPPGADVVREPSQFLNHLVRFSADADWQQMINDVFRDFWYGKFGQRWRERYTLGAHSWCKPTMGEWGCPFCPGQKQAAGWSQLVVDETLESVIQQADQKCNDAKMVDVRCCPQAEAEDGPQCGVVPLLVSGRQSGLVLGWSVEQDDSEDSEEEVDLT